MILHRKGNRWALCPYKVKYRQHGKELEKYTADKQWWNDFADKWEHTDIIAFEDVEWSDQQKERLEEIRRMPEDFGSVYSDYVKDGTLPADLPEGHPFRQIILKGENESQGQSVTENEIENMEQGQKQSDFEIRLMQLEGAN